MYKSTAIIHSFNTSKESVNFCLVSAKLRAGRLGDVCKSNKKIDR